jgi:hypothetical protein
MDISVAWPIQLHIKAKNCHGDCMPRTALASRRTRPATTSIALTELNYNDMKVAKANTFQFNLDLIA